MEFWKQTGNEPGVSTKRNMQSRVSSEATTRITGERQPQYKNTVHLWEFLLELLADDRCTAIISWSNKECGEFRLKDQREVAKRWGILKQRPGMNYDKLSRALRYYYKQGIVKKVPGQKLIYKFDKLPYNYRPGLTCNYQEQLNKLERKRRYLRNIHDYCCTVQAMSPLPLLREGMVKHCNSRQPKFYYPDSYFHYNARAMCCCLQFEIL